MEDETKDVDLQRADLQSSAIEDRAQVLASSYSMDIEPARQLTQLADKMSQFSNKDGGMTQADQNALAEAALGVAGIKIEDVKNARDRMLSNGDQSGVNSLMTKAAANLGMPSAAGLRDQILPSLGINLSGSSAQ